jgi:rsbT co-antagonist protein RsbR
MPDPIAARLTEVVSSRFEPILQEWMRQQLSAVTIRPDLLRESELRDQSRSFLELARGALNGAGDDVSAQPWQPVRDFLGSLSASRAQAGFTPSQTATFVLSLKRPLFDAARGDGAGGQDLADVLWRITVLLDHLALVTTEAYQKTRNAIISRQQQELLELSTPVVSLWQGVLAVPLIGTLDSARTQVVMENLLERIVDTGAEIAIIDITGVPTVDTMVAQHLLKTIAAARLMGADCIISGIRPQIAQTIVHLGVELGTVSTKATLADAFALALRRSGLSVVTAAAS